MAIKRILKEKKEVAAEKKAKVVLPKKAPPKPQAVPSLGLHDIALIEGAHTRKKIKGRGPSSGHGKTSTRGSKGQTSRAGRDMYPGFEGGQTPLIRRMPKRGFHSLNRKEYQIINVGQLSRITLEQITPAVLKEKGMIKNTFQPVKVLGEGEISHAINIQAHAFSKSAQEKLKKSGSRVEVLNA